MKKVVVSISCITYNHAAYIRECLDGFLMQKTNFKFEVLIHDDASTDGTEEIIREYEVKYPDIIKPLYEKENQWLKGRRGSRTFNFPRAKGKYIALCEGDDYWTDPNKLQKQVDFLEANEAFGMVYTDCQSYDQEENKFGLTYPRLHADNDAFHQLVLVNSIQTPTVLIRRSLLNSYNKQIVDSGRTNWKMGDYPMWLYISANSKIKFLDEFSAVYRVLKNSASHFIDKRKEFEFLLSTYEIKYHFLNIYPDNQFKKKVNWRLIKSLLRYAVILGDDKVLLSSVGYKNYLFFQKKMMSCLSLLMKVKAFRMFCSSVLDARKARLSIS